MLNRPRQALLEKKKSGQISFTPMTSSYTPVYPIAFHLFMKSFKSFCILILFILLFSILE